jgi:hypothetical protein
MDMSASACASLTGWMSNLITGIQVPPEGHPSFLANMQMENHPTSTLVSIAVQIKNHNPWF